MNKIQNPILKGFYPDPSIVRVGKDYYIATSTFEWFPGICLLHSCDLKHWETLVAPLDKEQMLDLKGIDTSCGIWAPNLTYDNGIFYLIYTIVYTDRPRFKDTHNFLITARHPDGPWSKPVFLNCSGFDPSLFHDSDGRKWLVNMTVDHRPDKERFGGVVLQEYDVNHQNLTGQIYEIFKGTEIGKVEGPNLYKHNGYYYLLCAEGGTEFGHCCTFARCKQINGVYEVHPNNPILSSKATTDYPLQRAGHGALVETEDHKWLMAHLCSSPINGFSILGRETAIQNVEWTPDDWLNVISSNGKLPMTAFTVPELAECVLKQPPVRENFDEETLPREFMTLRQSPASCGISATERKGFLRIHGGNSLCSKYKQGLLARRLQSLFCDCTACIEFQPKDYHHMAGLVCYYNYDNYYYIKISRDETIGKNISITCVNNRTVTETEAAPLPQNSNQVSLTAKIRGKDLQFYYFVDQKSEYPLGPVLDMTILSDEHVEGNGFTGTFVGMCCQDLRGDGVYADFDWFEYKES